MKAVPALIAMLALAGCNIRPAPYSGVGPDPAATVATVQAQDAAQVDALVPPNPAWPTPAEHAAYVANHEREDQEWAKRVHAAALVDHADRSVCTAQAQAATAGLNLTAYFFNSISIFQSCMQARQAERAAAAATQ